MKAFTSIVLLLFMVPLVYGNDSDIKSTWFNEGLSPEGRAELVEELKKRPFDEIAPFLLKTLVENQPYYGFTPLGDFSWDDDRLKPRDRTYLMASAVWQYHMKTKDDPTKAKTLLILLQEEGQTGKTIIIGALRYNQWCPEAESALLDIALNKTEDLTTRQLAVSSLLHRCDPNTYIPLGMEIVNSYMDREKDQAFNVLTNLGNRLYDLSENNRDLLLNTGFEIITQLDEENLRQGYFVAGRLGFILRIPGEFAPDQKAEKYQGPYGLTDDFFIDTVKNALQWYSENKATNQLLEPTLKTPVNSVNTNCSAGHP